MPSVLIAICVAVLGYALISRWLSRRSITAPMIMIVAGGVSFSLFVDFSVERETVHILAEIALVLVLFHDASTINLRSLGRDLGPPIRLLLVGFPLAVAMTLGTSVLLLPSVGVYGALLIAGAVTPTDAGLGAPTILNPQVPLRIRRLLNVESGLNDGLATPIVLFALTAVAATEDVSLAPVLDFAVKPLAIGVSVGIAVVGIAGFLVKLSIRHGLATAHSRSVIVLLVPAAIFLVAEVLHGNIFLAAFCGGLTFAVFVAHVPELIDDFDFLDVSTDLLSWIVWFLAGGLTISVFAAGITWQSVAIAVMALTVVRVIPVAIALTKSGFRVQTVAFVGWFGPRGLATVVFALLIAEELGPQHPIVQTVVVTLALTVLLSVVAHGLSATPFAARYGAWVAQVKPPAETQSSNEPRVRGASWARRQDPTTPMGGSPNDGSAHSDSSHKQG